RPVKLPWRPSCTRGSHEEKTRTGKVKLTPLFRRRFVVTPNFFRRERAIIYGYLVELALEACRAVPTPSEKELTRDARIGGKRLAHDLRRPGAVQVNGHLLPIPHKSHVVPGLGLDGRLPLERLASSSARKNKPTLSRTRAANRQMLAGGVVSR